MTFADPWRCHVRARWLFVRGFALLVALVAASGDSVAGQAKLAWDAVANATGYRLYYGTSSGNYPSSVDAANQTTVTVSGLTDGARYYFAVKAYNSTTTSNFSTETSTVVQAPAPVVSFSASPSTGVAPLVVTLSDTSSGSITSRSWNLGDGTTATTQMVAKTYSNPGTYVVTLTATGSGGSATASKSIAVATPVISGSSGGTTSTGSGGTTSSGSGGTTSSGSGGTTSSGSGGTTSSGSGGTTSTIAPHTKGLVAAYGFEELTDSEVIDASGNANRGRISGATRVRTTRFGRALKFDGRGDWVTVDDSASLDLTKAMTLEAWVYPTVRLKGWTTVLLKETSRGLAYSLYASSDAGTPSNTVNAGGADRQLNAGPSLPVNTWTHVAATYDGASQKLYVNGSLVGSRPQTGAMVVAGGKLRIGGNAIWGMSSSPATSTRCASITARSRRQRSWRTRRLQ